MYVKKCSRWNNKS